MTDLGRYASMNMAYSQLCNEVALQGFNVTTEGRKAVEVRPASFTISRSRCGLYTGQKRRLNLRFWALETLCYMGGVGGSTHGILLTAANKSYARYGVEGTGELQQMLQYGPPLRDGLKAVYRELQRDTWSRRAYASVWDAGAVISAAKSYCTTGMQFMAAPSATGTRLRLDMHVSMRSNDLNWGTPYDVAAFCAIQMAMAACLQMDAGEYHHTAGSLHFYENGPVGECPAPVPSYTDENFDDGPWIPEPPNDIPWGIMAHFAWIMCEELKVYIQSDRRLSEFCLPANRHWIPDLDDYAEQWAAIIRSRRAKEVED